MFCGYVKLNYTNTRRAHWCTTGLKQHNLFILFHLFVEFEDYSYGLVFIVGRVAEYF